MSVDIDELIAEARKVQSTGKRPRYSREFKRKTVILLKEMSKEDLAEKLGISPITIEGWRRDLGPRNRKRRQRLSKKSSPIDFVPVIPPDTVPIHQIPTSESHFRLEFRDSYGKHLSISMPWDQQLAGSLIEFVSQTINGGAP